MVTFGQNTVHTYQQGAAPASTPAFGSAPAPGGGSAFGGTAPAPTAFGSSSSTFGPQQQQPQPAAPAPSMFGGPQQQQQQQQQQPAPAAPSSVFGSSSAPAPATTAFNFGTPSPAAAAPLFGSPPAAGGLFGGQQQQQQQPFSFGTPGSGTTTGGLFGGPQPQQQPPPPQQPQVPYAAAIQAHIHASARNEHDRVVRKMTRLYDAYQQGGSGSAGVVSGGETDDSSSHCFSTVLYNPATAQELQLRASLPFDSGGGADRLLLSQLQKPPQISERDWRLACVRNPDPRNFVPVAVTGADALALRSLSHQEQAAQHDAKLAQLRDCADALRQRSTAVRRRLSALRQSHAQQGRRLLKLMKHVEVARCFHLGTQNAETDAADRLRELHRAVEDDLAPAVAHLLAAAASHQEQTAAARQHPHPYPDPGRGGDGNGDDTPTPQQQRQWMAVLQQHRAQLTALTDTVSKDERDLQLIRDRVVAPSDPAGRSRRRWGGA